MSTNTTIIEMLRSVRNTNDLIEKLKENSHEARRDRIANVLASDDWEYGPADLIFTYESHALANKNGSLIQVELDESGDEIKIVSNKLFESSQPVNDVAYELMETAKNAAELILSEDFDAAMPMLNTILKTIDVSGNLQERLETHFALSSLKRDPWYSKNFSITESLKESLIYGTVLVNSDLEESRDAVDDLTKIFKSALRESLDALKSIKDHGTITKNQEAFAADLAEDVSLLINTLVSVNRDSEYEMKHVYEGIAEVGDVYLSGLKSLSNLAKSQEPDESSGSEEL